MFWAQTQFQIIGPVIWLHDLSFSIGKQPIYRRWIAACMCYLLHSKLLRLFFYFVPNTLSTASYNASSRRDACVALASPMVGRWEAAGEQDAGDPRVPTLLPCHPRPYETNPLPCSFTKYLHLRDPWVAHILWLHLFRPQHPLLREPQRLFLRMNHALRLRLRNLLQQLANKRPRTQLQALHQLLRANQPRRHNPLPIPYIVPQQPAHHLHMLPPRTSLRSSLSLFLIAPQQRPPRCQVIGQRKQRHKNPRRPQVNKEAPHRARRHRPAQPQLPGPHMVGRHLLDQPAILRTRLQPFHHLQRQRHARLWVSIKMHRPILVNSARCRLANIMQQHCQLHHRSAQRRKSKNSLSLRLSQQRLYLNQAALLPMLQPPLTNFAWCLSHLLRLLHMSHMFQGTLTRLI